VSNTNRFANGSTILNAVDGRSAEGRRYRDLCISLVADLGGIVGLPKRLRRASPLRCSHDHLRQKTQVGLVRGEAVDLEQLARVTNGLTRLLNAIKARHKPKSVRGHCTNASWTWIQHKERFMRALSVRLATESCDRCRYESAVQLRRQRPLIFIGEQAEFAFWNARYFSGRFVLHGRPRQRAIH